MPDHVDHFAAIEALTEVVAISGTTPQAERLRHEIAQDIVERPVRVPRDASAEELAKIDEVLRIANQQETA